jgi:hypothetical protein
VPPAEASWVALRFLKHYSPLKGGMGDAPLLDPAVRMLASAVRRLDGPAARQAFTEMTQVAQTTPTPNWAWPVLDRLVSARPGGTEDNLSLELAWQLCRRERMEPLLRALALADEYEKTMKSGGVPKATLEFAADNIKYVRAKARLGLYRQGETRHGSPEPLLRELDHPVRQELRTDANLDLVQFLDEQGRHAEALGIGLTAVKEWPDEVGMREVMFFGQLEYGESRDVAATARMAAEVFNKSGPTHNNPDWLFLGSLAGILGRTADWKDVVNRFLTTDHVYCDYVRMIAFAQGGGTASPEWNKMLNERWTHVDPGTWPDRIRNGDESAWREMLIGRFVGAKASDGLFTTLEDRAAWTKSDFANLPSPVEGQRCEAWFYEAMRAKAEGRKDYMRECLNKSVATGYRSYLEFALAKFLLANPD